MYLYQMCTTPVVHSHLYLICTLVSANWDWGQSSEHQFASNKGYKATKRSDKHKGKEGDKSNKMKSGRKESGQVLRQRKGTWYVHLQEWFIQVICWLRIAIFCKGIAVVYSSRNSCCVYSQDQEKSKLKQHLKTRKWFTSRYLF